MTQAFQTEYGLTVDGVAGQNTKGKLASPKFDGDALHPQDAPRMEPLVTIPANGVVPYFVGPSPGYELHR